MTTKLEIAVQDAVGARIAMEHGADRVELCAALGMGGLTPSLATIEQVVAVGIGVHVLIRPRGGDYIYSLSEVAVMVADIRHAVRAGVAGIVIGALTDTDTALDIEVLGQLIAAARTEGPAVEITVHRCVDILLENGMSASALIVPLRELEVDRILTSGGAPTSGNGVQRLHQLHAAAAGNPQIQAGGGVRIPDILVLNGLDGIHLSARTQRRRGGSGPGGGESEYDVTSPELVTAAVAALASVRTE